tara:strand:+ start:712 stop:1080 length:369 start_codon:yes stop_codon:yes gene_type:complete
MQTIEIDGVRYKLTPVDSDNNNLNDFENTFYYGACSDCGHFEFVVLINEDNSINEGTQAITYSPKGELSKDGQEYWDNDKFLIDLLKENNTPEVRELKDSFSSDKYNSLRKLLVDVNERNWL